MLKLLDPQETMLRSPSGLNWLSLRPTMPPAAPRFSRCGARPCWEGQRAGSGCRACPARPPAFWKPNSTRPSAKRRARILPIGSPSTFTSLLTLHSSTGASVGRYRTEGEREVRRAASASGPQRRFDQIDARRQYCTQCASRGRGECRRRARCGFRPQPADGRRSRPQEMSDRF